MLFKNELPTEEVYDSVRGHQDLAVDEEGNPTDQQLLDFQHHVHGSITGPLFDPLLERGRWADMIDEAGEVPMGTAHYPGGHCSVS